MCAAKQQTPTAFPAVHKSKTTVIHLIAACHIVSTKSSAPVVVVAFAWMSCIAFVKNIVYSRPTTPTCHIAFLRNSYCFVSHLPRWATCWVLHKRYNETGHNRGKDMPELCSHQATLGCALSALALVALVSSLYRNCVCCVYNFSLRRRRKPTAPCCCIVSLARSSCCLCCCLCINTR